VIGGGAAGLMTVATIHELAPEAEIFLIERNNGLGKKVIISGGGRCNVTTGIRDVRMVLTKYPRGGKFLSSAMHWFPPQAVYEWFESRGVPLKIEDDLRVFPKSDNGKDIVGVFEKLFNTPRIHTLLNAHAISVKKTAHGFEIFLKGHDRPLIADALVITTGGQAYRATGSTGDGYAFALLLGHTITSLAPSLNAFFTREKWPAEISGLSFSKARFTASCSDNPKEPHDTIRANCIKGRERSYVGPFLFTHKGVSGPAVFALSSLVAFEKYDAHHPLEIMIDLFPDLSIEKLTSDFMEKIKVNAKKSFANVVALFVPKSLAEIACRELEFSDMLHAGEVGKKEATRIVSWLKAIPLHVTGRGAGDEFVTAGGVTLTEINPHTMESKMCPDLYFAGEILDVDGYTGGFNLQASWAAGHVVGESIAEKITGQKV